MAGISRLLTITSLLGLLSGPVTSRRVSAILGLIFLIAVAIARLLPNARYTGTTERERYLHKVLNIDARIVLG